MAHRTPIDKRRLCWEYHLASDKDKIMRGWPVTIIQFCKNIGITPPTYQKYIKDEKYRPRERPIPQEWKPPVNPEPGKSEEDELPLDISNISLEEVVRQIRKHPDDPRWWNMWVALQKGKQETKFEPTATDIAKIADIFIERITRIIPESCRGTCPLLTKSILLYDEVCVDSEPEHGQDSQVAAVGLSVGLDDDSPDLSDNPDNQG